MTFATQPSICIPRTLANVSWFQVKQVFEDLLGKGTVERVDLVKSNSTDHRPFCRIFVHLRYWPVTDVGQDFRERLVNGETVTVMYDRPWFWKCVASTSPKPESNRAKTAPYIEPAVTPTEVVEDVVTEDVVTEDVVTEDLRMSLQDMSHGADATVVSES